MLRMCCCWGSSACGIVGLRACICCFWMLVGQQIERCCCGVSKRRYPCPFISPVRPMLLRNSRVLRFSLVLFFALLSGCQSWTTVELRVPAGKDAEVREKIREVSTISGLLSCAHWKIRVRNTDACYGGQIDGNGVTVVAVPSVENYAVRISVFSSGLYNKASFQSLELRYRSALEQVFLAQDIQRDESSKLLEVEAE